jgi:hypothetical protein
MFDYLADIFAFVARVNRELGKIRNADKCICKALNLKLKAKILKEEAEQYQISTE